MMKLENEIDVPTHYCVECGALWRFQLKKDTGFPANSWSLVSRECGNCCDNEPMEEQIQPLTIKRLKNWL